MKKLTLALAVLATASISLFSFTKSKTPAESEKQTVYYWVRYGCQNYGASQPTFNVPGMNYWTTTDPGMPQGNCPEMQSYGVCAVRFLRSEITCDIPGMNGMAVPLSDVNPWDGNHMIKYCSL